jgi:hypothetical protein
MRIATITLGLAVLLAAGAASGDWLPGSPWPTPKHDQYNSGCAPPGVPKLQRVKVLWTYQATNPVNPAENAGPHIPGVWSINPSGWLQSDNTPNIVGNTIFMSDFEYVYALRDNGATVTVLDRAKFENEPPLDTWYNCDKIPIQSDGAGNLLLHFSHETYAWQTPGVEPYNYHVISWDGANFSSVYDGQVGKMWRQGAIDPVTGNVYYATFNDFDPAGQGADRRSAWAYDIANNNLWTSVAQAGLLPSTRWTAV